MMRIKIEINGREIERINIVNEGRIDDVGRPDARRYRWEMMHGSDMLSAYITHNRSDGALALAQKVISSVYRLVGGFEQD